MTTKPFEGTPGVDHMHLSPYFDFEPNSGIMKEISGCVKENIGIVTFLVLFILAAIAVCSIYYGFGDFHHFATWVNDNSLVFSAIVIGIGILGLSAFFLIKSKMDEPDLIEEEFERNVTPFRHSSTRQIDESGCQVSAYSALDGSEEEEDVSSLLR